MDRCGYIALLGFILFGLAGCTEAREDSAQPEVAEVIATINEERIYKSELDHSVAQTKRLYEEQGLDTEDEHLIRQIEEQILADLINQELILQAAERQGITDNQIEAQIDEIKSQYGDESEFLQELKENNMTIKDLKQMMKIELFVESHLKDIKISEEEIDEMINQYNEFTKDKINKEEVRPMIENELTQRKRGEKLNQLIEKLKEENEVQIIK